MSKKHKFQAEKKPSGFSGLGNIFKSLPTWLKFAGLLVPVLGLILSYLNYSFEREKYSEDIKVLVSTESNLNIGAKRMNVYPPMSISFITKRDMTCGRDLIISNTGGVATALVGIQGRFSHPNFPQSIVFHNIGNEVFLADQLSNFPKDFSSFMVTILNDHHWLLTEDIFNNEDILAFPVEIQAHSSFKVRVAIKLGFKTENEAYLQSPPLEDKGNPKMSLQFITSTSKVTDPVEFECFDGMLIFPEFTTFSTPQATP